MAETNLISRNGASTNSNNVVIVANGSSAGGQTNNKKKLSNGVKLDHNTEPPDGGARAWFVMISAFLCNSIIFGVINTYGVIYLNLQEKLTSNGDLGASSKAGKLYIAKHF